MTKEYEIALQKLNMCALDVMFLLDKIRRPYADPGLDTDVIEDVLTSLVVGFILPMKNAPDLLELSDQLAIAKRIHHKTSDILCKERRVAYYEVKL